MTDTKDIKKIENQKIETSKQSEKVPLKEAIVAALKLDEPKKNEI